MLRRDAGAGVGDGDAHAAVVAPPRSSRTAAPSGQYLSALSTRLPSTCSSARRSALHVRTRRRRRARARCASPARDGRAGESVRSTTRARDRAARARASARATRCARARADRRSDCASRSALRWISSMKRSAAFASFSTVRSVSAAARTVVSGLRSSCDAFATKSRRTASSRRSSVTSTNTASTPPGASWQRDGAHQRAPRHRARRARARPRSRPPCAALSSSWFRSALRTTCSTDLPIASGADQQHRAQRRVREHDAAVARRRPARLRSCSTGCRSGGRARRAARPGCAKDCPRAGRAPCRARRSRRARRHACARQDRPPPSARATSVSSSSRRDVSWAAVKRRDDRDDERDERAHREARVHAARSRSSTSVSGSATRAVPIVAPLPGDRDGGIHHAPARRSRCSARRCLRRWPARRTISGLRRGSPRRASSRDIHLGISHDRPAQVDERDACACSRGKLVCE